MMKTSKILININDFKEISEYKKIGIDNFLFAVKGLSIGYKAFSLEDIPKDSYLLINRLMDTDAIALVRQNISLISEFRGVLFEDVGVFNLLKNTGIELIWFQNHFATNSLSINTWLSKGANSAVISNELTRDEISNIVANANAPIVFNVFGRNQIMYSRRHLLSNFNKFANIPDTDDMTLYEPHTDNTFLAREEEWGTVLFNKEYFNYCEFASQLDDSKIRYYLIFNMDLPVLKIENIVHGSPFGNTGFLDKRTVYRMEEYTDR